MAALARAVLARLARGTTTRFAFGDIVTIGRVGATLTAASPLVSRVHLALRRVEGVAFAEDLGSHNGTWLAGARVVHPLAVGDGLDLELGRGVPCAVRTCAHGLVVDLAGERTVAPLGPLVVGPASAPPLSTPRSSSRSATWFVGRAARCACWPRER